MWYRLLASTNEKKADITVAHARPVKFHDARFWGKKSRNFRGDWFPLEEIPWKVFPWWSVPTH